MKGQRYYTIYLVVLLVLLLLVGCVGTVVARKFVGGMLPEASDLL